MVAAALAIVLSLLQLPQPPKHLSVATPAHAVAATPGSTVRLYVDVTPNRGIHVYAPGAKDFLPIALTIDPKPGVAIRALKYPAPETMEFEGENVPVYGKPFRLVQDVSIARSLKPGATLTVTGTLHYQACDDAVCFIPATAPVSWTIAVAARTGGRGGTGGKGGKVRMGGMAGNEAGMQVEEPVRHEEATRLHFLNIAEGSLAEVAYCIHAAKRLGYISEATFNELEIELNRVGAPLAGLIRSAHLMPIATPLAGGLGGAICVLVLQHVFR